METIKEVFDLLHQIPMLNVSLYDDEPLPYPDLDYNLYNLVQSSYVGVDVPRSRVQLAYNGLGATVYVRYLNLIQYANRLVPRSNSNRELGTVSRYPEILRFNSGSNSIQSVLSNASTHFITTRPILLFGCSSRANYQLTKEYVDSMSNCATRLSESDDTTFYSVCGNAAEGKQSILCVSSNITQATIDTAWQLAMSAVYAYFVELHEGYDDNLKDILKPENLVSYEGLNSFRINKSQLDEWAVAQYEIIKAKVDEVQAAIKAEEERKLAEQRSRLISDSLEVLSNVKLKDNREAVMEEIRSSINSLENYIQQYTVKLEEYIAKKAAKMNEFNSYAFRPDEQLNLVDVLKDFIGPDKSIRYVTAPSSTEIRLHTVCPIVYWEEDEVAQWKNTNCWSCLRWVVSNKYELMTATEITVNVSGGYISGKRLSQTCTELLNTENLITHPHVGRYSCFGNNEYSIREAIRNRNFDVAFALINQSIYQINLTDGCVVTSLCETLKSDMTRKLFRDKETGVMYSIKELEEMEAANNESN